jgi:ribonuclease HI
MKVFTDGACKSNGKTGASASYAAWFPDNKEWSFATKMPAEEPQTNQRAELKAIHDAVKIVYEKCPLDETSLEIYTDSQYSKNCLSLWLASWIKKNWKTTEGGDVKHRDLIEPLHDMLSKLKEYKIIHVKAHTGEKDYNSIHNDIVDKMATGILTGIKEEKKVDRNEDVLPGLALSLMGPPLEQNKIVEWCMENFDKLDKTSLKTGLFSAFQKTMKKNGYTLEQQNINKTKFVRLTKNLIKDSKVIQ